MENYIQDIELINNYINKILSETEIQDFEKRLKTDLEFNSLFEEHIVFLEGLKRQQLKTEIKKAKQSYIKAKWFKFFGLTIVLLTVLAVVYFNVFNSDKTYLKNKLNFESEYIQSFQVAADSLIEIIGEKGTVIRFNANDLETTSNKPFAGDSLNVELIELITKQDLLLANAQTVSNGKWLVSGGAFKIDIKYKEESLVLKAGKTINAKFPKNTQEDNMQLFYGERNKQNNMNWKVSNIKLKDKKYYTIKLKDTVIIHEAFTERFGITIYVDTVLVDTLGYLKYDFIKTFPELEIKLDNDTLRVYKGKFYKQYSKIEMDNILEDETSLSKYISISKLKAESLINNTDYDISSMKVFELLNRVTSNFYKYIEISKLGWINIDKFAPEEEKVTVKFNFNIKTKHNEIYIIDERNNTVLNVYNDEIDLPINRSFYIIAIGINGKDIYGFKKSFRFKKPKDLKIDYKKINEAQIKSILNINSYKTPKKSISNKRVNNNIKAPVSSEDTLKTEKAVLKDEVKIPKKQSQKFIINIKRDTLVTCKEGTKLTIKANAFTDQNNKVASGAINLEVTEYYKLSDVLLANLSTQSNGKQLETGGMLFIKATQHGKKLKLNKGKAIEIVFPLKKNNKDMQLFSGVWEDDIINWKLQEDLLEVVTNEKIEIEEDVDVPFSVIEQVPIYPGCEAGNNSQQKECMSEAINKLIQRKFNTQLAVDLGLSGRQRINVIFKINKDGNVVDIRSRATDPELEKEAKRVIALLPKMKPGKHRGRKVSVLYSLPITFQVYGESGVSRYPINRETQDSIYIKKIEDKLEENDTEKITVSHVNNYILKASKLGWINCDRFISTSGKVKYQLKMNDAIGVIRLNMVFKSMNSVLPSRRSGGEFDFKMVPKNENVALVAIKKNNGKLYLDVVETKTEENPNISFDFKEVSLQVLKSELKKLDKVF